MDTATQQRLVELEEQIASARAERLQLLRESTDHSPVDDFPFETTTGSVSLSQLFGEHDDLIVIHNMGVSCRYCTLWADGFNGVLPHLKNRAAFAVVSPDAPDAQASFAKSRAWNFTMVSDTSGFTAAMGYRMGDSVTPGFSTFRKKGDVIRRIGHAPFGPGDPYSGIWHLFAMLDGGFAEWSPKFRYPAA